MSKLPPIPKTFTAVLAERELTMKAHGKHYTIHLKIGTPVQDVPTASGLDWRCPFVIRGIAQSERPIQAYGIDSLQCLIHALALVEVELTSIEREFGEQLFWLEDLPHGCPKIDLTELAKKI